MSGTQPASGPGSPGARVGGASNLVLRIASAVVLAPVAVGAAYVNGWPFAVFWGLAAMAVLWEWTALVAGPGHRLMFSACGSAIAVAALVAWLHRPIAAMLVIGLGALAAAIFAAREHRLWITAGIAYAGILLLAPMYLRADESYGFLAIVFLFAVVWATDIFAYFGGRTFGGPKVWPAISPKKTWSGAIAGAFAATVAGVAVARWSGAALNDGALAAVAAVLSVLSQIGDFMESFVKRRFGAKDASHLIPGHGGVMDRLDSFWAAALAGCLIGLIRAGFDAPARGLLLW
ncbi:MAG TPA: phosphatidate cytidylyltransferase [Pseudolabrys sp.]|nr:phosphatidate cytidylyltransferase [Pseudolabrys sp.]